MRTLPSLPSSSLVLRLALAATCGLLCAACGSDPSETGGAAGSTGTSNGGSGGSSGGAGGTTTPGGGGAGGGTGGGAPGDIGVWTDAPGACPEGLPRVDLHTAAELASASRGEDAYASDAPATCYFLHDGSYDQSGVVLYATAGGEPGGKHRVFVGESRDGVVVHGRASVEDGVGDLTITNMTFDLTGYAQDGSFNTLSLGSGSGITVDHVTFTGDCQTGLKGGHVETNGTKGVLVEACLIERFGHCGGGGHEDHGVYLASGADITLRNNVIRQNSSRGVQMYTAGGDYGALDGVLLERNLIVENGHADYEDGVVMNGADTGTITGVTIRRNLFVRNHYSGIRFVGGAFSGVDISNNTFVQNGAGSSLESRSEINLDDAGAGAGAVISKNLFEVGNALINDCYDAASLGFGLSGDFVHGPIPAAPKGSCVGAETTGDPQLKDAAGGDYHPTNPAAEPFGAYAP